MFILFTSAVAKNAYCENVHEKLITHSITPRENIRVMTGSKTVWFTFYIELKLTELLSYNDAFYLKGSDYMADHISRAL